MHKAKQLAELSCLGVLSSSRRTGKQNSWCESRPFVCKLQS